MVGISTENLPPADLLPSLPACRCLPGGVQTVGSSRSTSMLPAAVRVTPRPRHRHRSAGGGACTAVHVWARWGCCALTHDVASEQGGGRSVCCVILSSLHGARMRRLACVLGNHPTLCAYSPSRHRICRVQHGFWGYCLAWHLASSHHSVPNCIPALPCSLPPNPYNVLIFQPLQCSHRSTPTMSLSFNPLPIGVITPVRSSASCPCTRVPKAALPGRAWPHVRI